MPAADVTPLPTLTPPLVPVVGRLMPAWGLGNVARGVDPIRGMNTCVASTSGAARLTTTQSAAAVGPPAA